jgi:hypothetical protein
VVAVNADEYFEFKGYYKAANVEEPQRSILARVIWQNEAGKQVGFTEYPVTRPDKSPEGWNIFEHIYKVPAATTSAKLELHYRWDADGTVRFSDVSFQKTHAPKARLVKLATIHYRPSNSPSAQTNLEHFSTYIATGASMRILSAPEAPTMVGTDEIMFPREPIPGPSTNF